MQQSELVQKENLLRRLGSGVLDLLFPPKCPFCEGLLEREEKPRGVCGDCWERNRTEDACRKEVEGLSECLSPLWYQGSVQESILRYKFHGRAAYAAAYAALLAECLTQERHGSWDVISWVPVSRKRLRERGYDQARLLAEELAKRYGVRAVSLLRKDFHNGAQSLLNDSAARRANVRGVYRVVDETAVRGRRVLLVDDVVTTGATLSECAVMLLSAGAAEVCAVTLARSRH